MNSFSDAALRGCFVNVSQRERASIVLPDLGALDWSRLDYLGWRDLRMPATGYVVAEVDGAPVGVLLRRAEASARARAQCSWCEDVRLPNDVVFYSARRAGAPGRKGDSLGTLVCQDFQCSANVRKPPPPAYLGYDVDAAVRQHIATLQVRVSDFARRVVG